MTPPVSSPPIGHAPRAEVVPARLAAPARRRRRKTPGEVVFNVVTVAPAALTMLIGIFVPFGVVVALSTTDGRGSATCRHRRTCRTTATSSTRRSSAHRCGSRSIYAAATTLFTIAIGFVLAAVIRERLRGWRFYKLVWFLPVLLPGTVVGLLFSGAFFTPKVGAIDGVTRFVGLSPPPNGWLGTPNLALLAVVATAVWASSGWPMIILLAAMERVPQDYLDAAALDGAGPIARTWYVTLPALRPVFVGVVTLQLIFGLKAFDIIFLMTAGGPVDATRVLGDPHVPDRLHGRAVRARLCRGRADGAIITPIGLLQQVFVRRGTA